MNTWIKKLLRSVCYAIFESHLCYVSFAWAQNTNLFKILHLLQKKSLTIMHFQTRNSHIGHLCKDEVFWLDST